MGENYWREKIETSGISETLRLSQFNCQVGPQTYRFVISLLYQIVYPVLRNPGAHLCRRDLSIDMEIPKTVLEQGGGVTKISNHYKKTRFIHSC